MEELPRCDHYRLLGSETVEWQVTAEVLLRFDRKVEVAQEKYEAFVADGIAAGRRPELAGGGLLRSAGGWEKIMLARRYGEHLKSDERILGNNDFLDEVLGTADEHFDDHYLCRANDVDIQRLAEIVAGVV